jgi:hypothetical protein
MQRMKMMCALQRNVWLVSAFVPQVLAKQGVRDARISTFVQTFLQARAYARSYQCSLYAAS